jgi:uncharacterized protein (TIGR02271 family)
MNPVREESDRFTGSIIPAYFRNPADAEKAISELSAAGFSKKEIGVALWDRDKDTDTAKSGVSGWAERLRSLFSANERQEYESHDALDVLDHMGIPEEQGRYFKNALKSGGVLLTVNAGGRAAQALSILTKNNAVTSQNLKSQNITAENVTDIGEQRIQLLGETLRVQKERVQTGAVKLRKEVVAERQNVEVPVTREEVVIERRPAEGRQTARTDFEDGKEIKVPVSEERVHVEKRPIVREEVAVGKRQVQGTKSVSDDVKHEELRVEKEGDISVDSARKRKPA